MRWICLLVLIFLPVAGFGEPIGTISRIEGKVTLFPQGGVRGKTLKNSGAEVSVGDVVTTHSGALAWLVFGQDRVLLKEDSSLRVTGAGETGVERGKVFFQIRKRTDARGLQVVGPTATIGVKGTRFAVMREQEVMDVYLSEGKLEVTAREGEFRKYSSPLHEDFESMREEMRAGFESSREKMRREFEQSVQAMREGDIEKVMSFDMEAGMAYRIAGQEVHPVEFPAGLEDDFRLLDRSPAD